MDTCAPYQAASTKNHGVVPHHVSGSLQNKGSAMGFCPLQSSRLGQSLIGFPLLSTALLQHFVGAVAD